MNTRDPFSDSAERPVGPQREPSEQGRSGWAAPSRDAPQEQVPGVTPPPSDPDASPWRPSSDRIASEKEHPVAVQAPARTEPVPEGLPESGDGAPDGIVERAPRHRPAILDRAIARFGRPRLRSIRVSRTAGIVMGILAVAAVL